MAMHRAGAVGGRCPSCGEYDTTVVIVHREGSDEGHRYCTNCDYGLCERCDDDDDERPKQYPLQRSDPHEHDWEALDDIDGKQRAYLASVCKLCGETQID